MTNRKILNATPVEVDGIQMKSKTERTIYLALKDLGMNPAYEAETFVYWKDRKPKTFFYDRNSKRQLRFNMKKLISIKYTPDFIFMYDGIKVIIEVKGWENDSFPLRKKLFRGYLDTLPYPVVYAEIFTKKQLLEFMEVLKTRAEEIKNQKKNMLVKRKRNPCTAILFDGNNWEEVWRLFNTTQPPQEDSIVNDLESCGAMFVGDLTFGTVAVKRGYWIVKDNITGLIFQMSENDFRERYDIITEEEA